MHALGMCLSTHNILEHLGSENKMFVTQAVLKLHCSPYESHMDVSINGGTPKSSFLVGFSLINQPYGGTPISGNTHIGTLRYDSNGPHGPKPWVSEQPTKPAETPLGGPQQLGLLPVRLAETTWNDQKMLWMLTLWETSIAIEDGHL